MTDIKRQYYRQSIGSWGEKQGEMYLQRQGLETIEKNYQTRMGELDIIARDGEEIVFVEVKTRTNLESGFPEEGVTDEKLEHLIEAAESYLDKHNPNQPWRMDVLAIIGRPGSKTVQFEWFKDVG
jgi:putative endonuclease